MSRRQFWVNQLFFQASWPACVVGAAHGLLWPGLLVVGAFALWQLAPARRHPLDLRCITHFFMLGLVLDSLWPAIGLVEYATSWPHPAVAPVWLLLLWISLALAVNHSLSIFKRRWDLFMLLAAVGSPLSYSAGAAFGAVEWTGPTVWVVLCLGPVWALLVGLGFRTAGADQRRLPSTPGARRQAGETGR